MADWLIVIGLGLTVAFTAIPIVTTIVAVVGARSSVPGWYLAVGYGACLLIVTVLLAGALQAVHLPQVDDPVLLGSVELVAGALLCVVGAIQFLRTRSGPRRPSRMMSAMQNVKPWVAVVVGVSFPLHPEALLLAATVATRVRHAEVTWPIGVIMVLLFVVLSISTVVAIAATYMSASGGMRERLERLQSWIERDSTVIMAIVVIVVGVFVVLFGANTLGWLQF
ncbi:type IV secretory pathway VirB2 component (pilin) [Microbacterium endophyticum]|uniref:Type IV secretory pathway VirB2 component (Pilin) n=1 Tax=Microbacterium endophyticum TaxID=1526412 RepID=A0A7W4YN05_9MICO|nr:GAP family protein [Microbacterium endophyticum]MBB2975221.1 type IV secretory pathway VirB2 component (pilin) [Microbacterium endophyticum]NIK37567.1 type IV secretory pathway VirB2 component (pilin) [Microbacterium endophyticum]